MISKLKVSINPKIMIWAREEMGMNIGYVAKKLECDPLELSDWEKDGNNIPFSTLKKVAKIYKRQLSVFFLSVIPKKVKKPNDHRNLAGNKDLFSPETLLSIRRANRYLETARQIENSSYWNEKYTWLANFNARSSTTISFKATQLRKILDVPISDQLKLRNSEEAFRYWRSKIEEKMSIFIFQFSMPEDELDGFSYAFDEFPFAIVINGNKSSQRKIFTLFNEVAHILRHTSGVCHTDLELQDRSAIEFECNNFAGKFLVPENNLEVAISADQIFELARKFKVSGEVYLRRLLEENKIKKNDFFILLEDVKKKSQSFRRKKRKSPISAIITSKSTRGNKLFDLVMGAAFTNKLSFSTAADILGLRIRSTYV